MYKINVISNFSGAHRLNGYPGACKNLHGHNWKVRIQLLSQKVDELGMGMDFKIVKDHLNNLMNKFDHQYLNELDWFNSSNRNGFNKFERVRDDSGTQIYADGVGFIAD